MKQTNLNHVNDSIVFGGGCFWCLDAAFSRIKGVMSVEAGYAGGELKEPTYEQVSGGRTGHAEVVRIEFEPAIITYNDLLNIFFLIHDPTTLNRQGSDVGPQYRSIILYFNEVQQQQAAGLIQSLMAEKVFSQPIVTELKPLKEFFRAEEYHQKYFDKNPELAYCQLVIMPKLAKLKAKYAKFYR